MTTPVVGVDGNGFLGLEAAFATSQLWAGVECFSYARVEITPTRDFPKKVAHKGTASLQGWTTGKYNVAGSIEVELKIGDVLGVSSEHANLMELCMGAKTAPSGVQWNFIETGAPPSGQLGIKVGNGMYAQCNGLVVTDYELRATGGAVVMLTANFAAAEYSFLRGTPTADTTTASTTVSLEADQAKAFRVADAASSFYVEFSTAGDNGGAGFEVTAVDYAADELTIDPLTTLVPGETVIPFFPTAAPPAGTEIQNIASGVTVDGDAIGFIEAILRVQTGFVLHNEEASTAKANRASRGAERTVEGDLKFYLLAENQSHGSDAWEGREVAAELRFGPDTATNRLKAVMPRIRLDVHPVEVPDAEITTYTARFEAAQVAGVANAGLELQLDAD